MIAAFDIMQARAQLYTRAQAHGAYLDYLHSNGLGVRSLADPDPVAEFCGCMAVTTIRPLRDGGFEFVASDDDTATIAAVIEALASDRETVVDLVAWPVGDASRVRSMFGRADCLGSWSIVSAASYVLGSPLMAYRTPLAWLQAGCRGVVVLDPPAAARRFLDAAGPISGEDREHSEDLARMVAALVGSVRFVAPVSSDLRKAA